VQSYTVQELNDLGAETVAQAFGLLAEDGSIRCPSRRCSGGSWSRPPVRQPWRCSRCSVEVDPSMAGFIIARLFVGETGSIDAVLAECARRGLRREPAGSGRGAVAGARAKDASRPTWPLADGTPIGQRPPELEIALPLPAPAQTGGGLTIADVCAAGVQKVAGILSGHSSGRLPCPRLGCNGYWAHNAQRQRWLCSRCSLSLPEEEAAWQLAVLSVARLLGQRDPDEATVLAECATRGLTVTPR
jgi:hypothetical protein